jgi:TolB-like protein
MTARRPTVFLSYASEDRAAARLLRDALPAYGLEVWYDENELGGGDAWDQKIRRQIRECDYFMPLISARTQARSEGYFRREWRLAVERTLDMADDHTYLLPVVIDDTDQMGARVPDKFFAVQWLRVPGGQPTAALEAMCRRVASGQSAVDTARKPVHGSPTVANPMAANATAANPTAASAPAASAPLIAPTPGIPVADAPAAGAPDQGKWTATQGDRQGSKGSKSRPPPPPWPEFPDQDKAQPVRFWFQVMGWALRSAWVAFQHLPRWGRVIGYIWLLMIVSSRGCSSSHPDAPPIPPGTAAKLKAIADQYQGNMNKGDIAKLGAQIAREFADADSAPPSDKSPLLAIPFTAAEGDKAGEKVASSTFAMVYGRIEIAKHGLVGLAKEPLLSRDFGAALERGRANHSTYVLYGTIETVAAASVLTVKIATVEDGSIVWSKSYPVAGADPAQIATEVESKLPDLDEG